MKNKIITILAITAALALTSCSQIQNESKPYGPENTGAVGTGAASDLSDHELYGQNGYNSVKIAENGFVDVNENATSTFSADVDTASYSMLRRLITSGYDLAGLIGTAGGGIRTEELINYFRYECGQPADGEPFGVKAKLTPCPWNAENKLLTLTVAAESRQTSQKNNLVFLVDVSGSMSSEDKLPLLKRTFTYLLSNLGDDDTVSIVTYASGETVVLEGCRGSRRDTIKQALDSLEARGSTNGEAGLRRAYEIAEKYSSADSNNRIIIASDGDLNVGMSSVSEIERFVEEKRGAGVYLSVLGFGFGNYRDAVMETIADKGNGAYYYIDGETEAERIFGDELTSTLYTVADDVKFRVTFDPEAVSMYRLIGYENRLLQEQDFANDAKDAGEVGAGSMITVAYELVTADDPRAPYFTLDVRYKKPGGEKSELFTYTADDSIVCEPDADTDLIAALCELSMILNNSVYKGTSTVDSVIRLTDHEYGDPYKAQFAELVRRLE